jgi:hypothetical protein
MVEPSMPRAASSASVRAGRHHQVEEEVVVASDEPDRLGDVLSRPGGDHGRLDAGLGRDRTADLDDRVRVRALAHVDVDHPAPSNASEMPRASAAPEVWPTASSRSRAASTPSRASTARRRGPAIRSATQGDPAAGTVLAVTLAP